MKLHITDEGDETVGMLSITYTVDTPFPDRIDGGEDIEWFRDRMKEVYSEFAFGNLTLMYEDE